MQFFLKGTRTMFSEKIFFAEYQFLNQTEFGILYFQQNLFVFLLSICLHSSASKAEIIWSPIPLRIPHRPSPFASIVELQRDLVVLPAMYGLGGLGTV